MSRKIQTTDYLRELIKKNCMEVYKEKGLKFTMDDIARRCRISKKTLYIVFKDKEALFVEMVNDMFDEVKECESEVMKDDSLKTEAKLRKLLGVLPKSYSELDFAVMYSLRDKYPSIYDALANRLETGWEPTFKLIEKGQKEGVFRKDVHVPIIKTMFEASLERFFEQDLLVKNSIEYKQALKEITDIIVDGILVK
ncbi:MAG: TetR/AcrR family transcriptional regulator [Lachnospiraceae bacterium]|nr:TetR/AcrR family transcriptional regulator [Lachnospiraceae bacterium]